MDLVLTDKCKDEIIHASDGIKFALRGYAFYSGELPDDVSENELRISDLDEKSLVTNSYKADITNEGVGIEDALFDLTFIPSLEGSVISSTEDGEDELVCKFRDLRDSNRQRDVQDIASVTHPHTVDWRRVQ